MDNQKNSKSNINIKSKVNFNVNENQNQIQNQNQNFSNSPINNINNNYNQGEDYNINTNTNKLNSSIMSSNVQIILKQIYEFYCQFGERLNTIYLKSHKFFKFAQEANMYDTNLTKIRLELIYKSEIGNNQLMDFKAFLNSLVKIADVKYNSSSSKKSSANELNNSGIRNNISSNSLNRIQSGHNKTSSAAYNLQNRSYVSNNSFLNNSQILENKKNKSSALGKLINEIIVPLHSNIFNNGSFLSNNAISANNNPFEVNQNNVSGIQGQGLTRSTSTNMINILRLDHKSISESKFIENLLIFIIPNLYEIYKIYFPHEVSISEDEKFIKDSSYKKYLIFLKEFDLCPGLISKTVGFQIFQNEVINPDADAEISENQEYYINLMKKIDINELTKYDPKNANIFGQFLNFFKFIRIIVKIAQVAYDNTNLGGYISSKPSSANLFDNNENSLQKNSMNRNSSTPNVLNQNNNNNNNTSYLNSNANNNYNNNFLNLSLDDKLILTLERIELSEGFLNLEKKTMKTHSKRTACLIPQNMLNNLKLMYSDKLLNYERNSLLGGKEEEKKLLYQNNIRLATNYKEICEFKSYIIEKWGDELHAIFKGYCAYGDYLNTKYMTSKKFFKFLNDCKLLEISTGSNFSLAINESCKSLNISRSVDNRLNSLITPKANALSNLNVNKINSNINNNHYNINNRLNSGKNPNNFNNNEQEIENFGANIDGGDSQIFPGILNPNRIKLLKPNDIDSIFVKLCATQASIENSSGERQSMFNKQMNRDSNIHITGNTSTNDLFSNQNTSVYGMERSSSSNRFSIKKVRDQRILFEQFILGIEIIARFTYEKMDVKLAVDNIVLEYIFKNVSAKYTEKFNDNKVKIEYLKKKQDDPDLLKILELIYETFGFAYEHYSDRKGFMNFGNLMK